MRSSGKIRVLVFTIFFIALIIFAVVYRPTNALSRPANQGTSTEAPAANPAQVR
jgi:hypothetical protein